MQSVICKGCKQVFYVPNSSSRREFHDDACKRSYKRSLTNLSSSRWFETAKPFPHSRPVNPADTLDVLRDVLTVLGSVHPEYYRVCLVHEGRARWYPKKGDGHGAYARFNPLESIALPLPGEYLLALYDPDFGLIESPRFRLYFTSCSATTRLCDCTDSWQADARGMRDTGRLR